MIFQNQSKLTLKKMQELVNTRIYRYRKIRANRFPHEVIGGGEEVGIIRKVDYHKNLFFNFIDGYKLEVEIVAHPDEALNLPYTINIAHLDYSGLYGFDFRELPSEFIDDMNNGIDRCKQLQKENEERLLQIANTPVEKRIIERYRMTDGNVTYGLHLDFEFSFHGNYEASFHVSHNKGSVRFTGCRYRNRCAALERLHFNDPIIYVLDQKEIDEFFLFYKSFDFFSHERSNSSVGHDGWSVTYIFHDGETDRFSHYWCPRTESKEYELVEFALRHFKKALTENDYSLLLEDIQTYKR